jgi:hypothetical protein
MKKIKAMLGIKIGKISLFIGFILSFILSFCQVDFKATSDYKTIPLNGKLTITYSLKQGKVEGFQRPDFSPFRVISQQSLTGTGGMTIIINNQVVNNDNGDSKWIFTLVPTTVGTFTIPPAKVKVNGKWYESNAITVTVLAQGKPQPATNQQTQVASTSLSPSAKVSPSQSIDNKNIYLRLSVDKTTAYVGEQIIVRLLLYTRYDVSEYALEKASMPSNVWSEELLDPKSPAKTWEEVIDGKRYVVAELRKTAIFPQVPGVLTIPSTEITAVVKIQDNRYDPFSLFDQFFKDPFNFNIDPFAGIGGIKLEKLTLRSNSLNINIMPLPEKGKPEGFQGAVGNFTANVELDTKQIVAGEMASLKITIQGKGNLPLIQYNPFEENDTIQLFEPDVQLNLQKTQADIEGKKVFTYLFQPNMAGKITLKLHPFYFFDPVRKQYDSIVFSPLTLVVEPNKGGKVAEAEQKYQEDIRGMVDPVHVFALKQVFGFSWKYWMLYGLFLSAAVAFTIGYRRRLKLISNVGEYKMLQAQKMAKKRLKLAEQLMKEKKVDDFYNAIAQTLWLFITEKFKVPYVELSRENARKVLEDHQIPSEVVNDFMNFLDEVDFYRFAPVRKEADMQEMYNKTANFIVALQLNTYKR